MFALARLYLAACLIACGSLLAADVSGVVTDPIDAVVPGVQLELMSEGRRYVIKSDGVGAFRFKDVPAGRYELRATMLGFIPFVAVFDAAADRAIDSVRINLEVAGSACAPAPPRYLYTGDLERSRLSGTVLRMKVGRGGTPLQGKMVQLLPGTVEQASDANGRFEFRVPPGTYRVELDGLNQRNVRVIAGFDAEILDGLIGEWEPCSGEECNFEQPPVVVCE